MAEKEKKTSDKIMDAFGVLGKFDPFQTYKYYRDMAEYDKEKKEVKKESKATGGFIVGKGGDYIKDLL